jgi:hypothetical protein
VIHAGSCRCGAVRFSASAEPFWRSYCHCGDCRKQSGAPVNAFVGWREGECTFAGEAPKVWRLGAVERSFCRVCGSQLDYRDDRLTGEVYVSLGLLDEPQDHPPALHAFESRRMPWLRIADDLPRYGGFSIER